MKITKKTYHYYYLFLALMIAAQAVTTVFKLGQTVHYQHSIRNLNQEQTRLSEEASQLERELSLEISLSRNLDFSQQDFVPITNPLSIESSQVVASR